MECKKTRDFCRALEKLGAITYPLVGSRFSPNGFPDRLIWSKQWQGLVEFKDTNTKVDKLQLVRIRDLNKRKPCTAFLYRFLERDIIYEVTDDLELKPVSYCDGPGHMLKILEHLYVKSLH